MSYYAEWSGKYPNRCNGEWEIRKNGYDISHAIPKKLRYSPMGTLGVYKTYQLLPDEHWIKYEDGLPVGRWIEENQWWISKICDDREEMVELYNVINAVDWRHGECGGCI